MSTLILWIVGLTVYLGMGYWYISSMFRGDEDGKFWEEFCRNRKIRVEPFTQRVFIMNVFFWPTIFFSLLFHEHYPHEAGLVASIKSASSEELERKLKLKFKDYVFKHYAHALWVLFSPFIVLFLINGPGRFVLAITVFVFGIYIFWLEYRAYMEKVIAQSSLKKSDQN